MPKVIGIPGQIKYVQFGLIWALPKIEGVDNIRPSQFVQLIWGKSR